MRTSRVIGVLALGAALATTAGCGVGPGAAGEPSPTAVVSVRTDETPATSPAPTPGPEPTAADVRAQGVAVVSGSVTLAVLARGSGEVTSRTEPDGSVTFGVPAGGAVVATPADVVVEVQDDGSVLLVGADGLAVGGLVVTDAAGLPTQVDAVAPDLMRLGAGGTAAAGPTGRLGTTGVASLDWGEREGGRSLAVEPTPWARAGGEAAVALIRQEMVAASPEADSPTMLDQLTCHALGARDKDTWNLEPWRADVGLLAVLAARCNPT